MTRAQSGCLAVALVGPLVAMLAGLGRPAPSPSRFPPFRRAQVVLLVAAGAWLILVAGGAWGDTGDFHVTPLVAAAGCGTTLIAIATLEGISRPRSVAVTCSAVFALSVGLTVGGTSAEAGAVVAGLALTAALSVAGGSLAGPRSEGRSGQAPRRNPLSAVLAAAGVAVCAVGFAVVHSDTGEWTLPTTTQLSQGAIVTFLAAAALLAAAGTLGLRSGSALRSEGRSGPEPAALLLAGGLAVGLSAAPLRVGGDELDAAMVVFAAAAVVAAGVRRGALSLALLALATAAGPAALTPGSRLLAAAAVIAAAANVSWAWLAAVPAAVSLATGVVDDGSRFAVAAAVGAAAVALLLAHAAAEEGLSGRTPGAGSLPAVAVGSWLVVAPGSWTWTGATLAAYEQGMARAAAAGLLAVVVVVLAGQGDKRDKRGDAAPVSRDRSGARSPSPSPVQPETPPAQLVTSVRSASPPRPRRATRSQRARPHGRVSARSRKGAERSRRRRLGPP